MSQNYSHFNVEYKVKVGSRETLTFNCQDSVGVAKDFTSTTIYNVARLKVWKPDGTLVINGVAVITTPLANGVVTYALGAIDAIIGNAGNWVGEIEVVDNGSNITYQTDTFSFVIQESF